MMGAEGMNKLIADTGGVAQGKIKRKRGENNNEEDKKDAKPVGSLTPM